jgi:hypothetical protein
LPPFNPHNYSNTMTMSALVNISGIHQTNGSLLAFDATGAVRGVQQTPSIPPFGAYVGKAIFQIMLYGNTAGDVLQFTFGPIPLVETVDFEINGNAGSAVAPFMLTSMHQGAPTTNASGPPPPVHSNPFPSTAPPVVPAPSAAPLSNHSTGVPHNGSGTVPDGTPPPPFSPSAAPPHPPPVPTTGFNGSNGSDAFNASNAFNAFNASARLSYNNLSVSFLRQKMNESNNINVYY